MTPTFTPTPALTQNRPVLIPNQHPLYEVSRFQLFLIQIKAFDADRDEVTFRIEPADAVFGVIETKNALTSGVDFFLQTQSQPGDYQITIFASDGIFEVQQELTYRILAEPPTQTPTSIATATPQPTATPTLIATETPSPTTRPTITPLPTLTPTNTPQPTRTATPTTTLTLTQTPLPPQAPVALPLPDLRILLNETGTALLDLDDYARDADTPRERLTWNARPLSDGLRLSIDAANQLYVEAPRRAGSFQAQLTLSDGVSSISQDIVIKISSFRLGDFYQMPPISLSSNETYLTPYSLFDGIEPDGFPTERIAWEIIEPLADGLEHIRVLDNGRVEIIARDEPPRQPIILPIIAKLHPTPTLPPSPTITPTSSPTPTQKPTRPTPTPAIIAQLCGRQLAFSKQNEIEVGAAPYEMAWADVNRDGRVDYLTANYGEANATLLLSNESNSYDAQSLPSGEGCLNVALDDLNDDGLTDAVLLGGYDSTLTYYQANASGFEAPVQWSLPELIYLPEERFERARIRLITAGRFFQGGPKCLAVALSNQIIFYQNRDGALTPIETLTVPFFVTQLVAADLDGDGMDELLAAHADPERMIAYRFFERSAEIIVEHPLSLNFFGNDPQDILTADINRDGLPDMAGLTFNREIHTLLSPDYSPIVFEEPVSMIVNDFEAGDFDRDGELEYILAGFDVETQQSSLAIVCGEEQAVFTKIIPIPISQSFPVGQQFTIAATDFNGDGWTDAVLLDSIANRLVFFANVTPNQP
ncbi:MAG: VCBS repeat-containing protein [Candidatus Hinthialibacter antarcticus]|nr:VCBS repeat-containing protein [Candidatus Hinthialibacter antarcticus]